MTVHIDRIKYLIDELETISSQLEEYDEYTFVLDTRLAPLARDVERLRITVNSQIALIRETI